MTVFVILGLFLQEAVAPAKIQVVKIYLDHLRKEKLIPGQKQQLGDSHNTSHYIFMSSGNLFMGNFGEDISPKATTWIVARCTVIRQALINRLCQQTIIFVLGHKLPT